MIVVHQMPTIHADILIAGGGLAGLTLALECARHPFFDHKKIIILERDDKNKNDRTWCFWATGDMPIPPVIYRSWKNCRFFGAHFERLLETGPFTYHMIRGIDFYRWAKNEVGKKANIEWVTADIHAMDAQNGVVSTNVGDFSGDWVFNAALRGKIDAKHPDARFTQLLQHFKGWVVETPAPMFDPSAMTFMDYRVEQKGDTRFVYVLPFSPTEALVEYTVFSPALCPDAEYDQELAQYLEKHLNIREYTVKETEFGVIPMADVPLPTQEGRLVHIGTAGGFVKGSSGYAFMRTQRKIRALVEDWTQNGQPNPGILHSSWRYRFYDSVMLRVLRGQAVAGSRFFELLFQKLPATLVFRFLDEDSTFTEDIRLLRVPPTWPFFKTALRQIPIFNKI